ncbi:large ribosomal subunit protein P2-like [Pseudophryne corroboree]|uniref:large ribosomal subunit protein P2-like n=1 Tax=Pseudophryne corroboree TaxID=495146 RepID=UPI0030816F32
MRYMAAYLLATLGGNSSPSAKDIKKILSSIGINADDERLQKVISELGGKDLEGLINSGLSKLCSVPSGGAVSAAPASASAPAAGGAAPPEKKEEVKEESEESDEDMGFGLFD